MAQQRHRFLLSSLAVGTAIAAVAIGILAASTGKTWPHEATPTAAMPQGWSYPFSCCSGMDCREVPDKAIVEGARGYEIRATRELIPMSDTRIKQSPDGHFHWCSVAGADDGRTICLFVPPRSF
ncbi:hypothetical protein P9279_21955 [Mesorhizobium sp. WSM4962]|uniref:hypothetical protein n=1 Tax=Mesorhizobium sp. WSM4962 TaxID=3038548 RepID=UPI002415D7FA|nr:hypothetical protein [Mesorhizobium sp. WSM4962]MDG4903177.1 hypothetical protein [Mesorhizobium sp. WSM4962]